MDNMGHKYKEKEVGMEKKKRMLAADFGASGGRVMAGSYDGEKIELCQIHRFSNDPVWLFNTMYWDFLRLLFELKTGIRKACQNDMADSIGVDTWGVDFGILDRKGCLMENPVHYRDTRTAGILDEVCRKISREELYQITGNQIMEINTAFQLYALVKERPDFFQGGEKLLLMPDLFNYYLSGTACSEYTIASTTQLLDVSMRQWSAEIMEKLELPGGIFQPVVMPGTKLGSLCDPVCRELALPPVQVIAVAGHDTQCALAAVPAAQEDFIFVSCGTWSLFGTELRKPAMGEMAAACNLTNEGAFGGKISFLKNITGLWLIQESRRWWAKEGKEYDFATLEEMAKKEEGKKSFIDPDDPLFMAAGDIPVRIQDYCKRTGQRIPCTIAEIVRCINESLALKYRKTLEEIRQCTGKEYTVIYMVGGGTQSALLCQLVADVCARPVFAGPVEATVYGNVLIQLAAMGEVEGLTQMRQLVEASEQIKVYEPGKSEEWEGLYRYYRTEILQQLTINIC